MRKFIFVLTVVATIISSCKHTDKEKKIRAVRLFSSLPIITADTNYTVSNSYEIFYCDNLTMYKFEYNYDSSFNGRLIKHESRPNFFVFEKDSSFGYSYYPVPDLATAEGRIANDTMFKRNAFEPFNFDSAFEGRKPDSVYFNSKKDIIKVYTTDSSLEYPEKFTYYLYYSENFAGLEDNFFSKSMNDEKGMKLFKIRMIGHGHYYKEYKFTLPSRELLYEMSEIPVKDTSEIMRYLDRYKKEIMQK